MAHRVIAVVDDDADVRDSLKFSLEVEGFRVRSFANGSELLRDAGLENLGCLIIDYHMPDMSGLELIERLRQRGLSIPSILVSNDPSRVIGRRASVAGVLLMEKTKLAETLIEAIRHALGPAQLP
ncbi:MAG: response regulator [Hyphomicrobiales bacterium]